MTDKKENYPLYGLKMDQLLTEISECYGWELLSETLNIERFQYHTGMKSTIKFLRNNQWAKEKVENFYLYQYKNFPYPDNKQLSIAPRDRSITTQPETEKSEQITDELIALIEKASKLRSDKTATKKPSTPRTEEPAYDPTNPWNK